jgi:hypothetical protein
MAQSNYYHDWQKHVPPTFGAGHGIPSSPPGQIPSKEPGLVAGWLHRVTLTYFIAVPLCASFSNNLTTQPFYTFRNQSLK